MATFKREIKKLPSEQNLRLLSSLVISLANKTSSVEDKCITPWKAGETYQKDVSFVVYNGYIYSCSVTNKDDTFTESHWTKLADNFDELSVDDVNAFLNLTPEEISKLSDIISTEIRLDKTFSSSDTYMRIQAAIDTAKEYTNNQLGKVVKPAYKVVSSTSEVTETGYFYLISNGTNYDMYVLSSDGTVVSLGTSEVDLSNYYTKTETDSDFLKKTDAASTYATITTVDGKVNKTDISTTIDSSSTNNQVPSAKAIYNKSKNKITDLPIGTDIIAYADSISNETVADTVRIMNSPNSPYGAAGSDFHYTIYNITDDGYKRIVAYDIRKNDMYMIMKHSGTWGTWRKVCTTKVKDVPKTRIELPNISPELATGYIEFEVYNGVCYMAIFNLAFANTSTGNIAVNIPEIPKRKNDGWHTISNVTSLKPLVVNIGANGGAIEFYTAREVGTSYYGTFSYLVAES